MARINKIYKALAKQIIPVRGSIIFFVVFYHNVKNL